MTSMFTRPRQKKQCRYTPKSIESKLKPLPNIGKSPLLQVTAASVVSRNRNTVQVSKIPNRSNDRSNTFRSGSVTERQHVHIGKVLNAVNKNKKARCVLPKYRNYGRRSDTNLARSDAASNPTLHTGRSSDPFFEDVSHKNALPDPYADLKSNIDSALPLDPNAPWWLFLAEMRLQARRQKVDLDTGPDTGPTKLQDKPADRVVEVKMEAGEAKKPEVNAEKTPDVTMETEKQNCKLEAYDKTVPQKKVSAGRGDYNVEKAPEIKSTYDATGTEETVADEGVDNDDDDEEEEEEDESGLPQAVRAMQQKSPTLNARDVVRERHRAMMEEIARRVSKNRLMSHLQAGGFFNHDYSQHARTSTTNHNLRKGKKKGMERLIMLLSCRVSKCTAELYGAV